MRQYTLSRSVSLLLPLLLALFLLQACRMAQESPEPLKRVWQAWGLVQENYAKREALDPQRLAGEAIRAMLELAQEPPYPFMTELTKVRGRPPRDVPPEMKDVWRAWVLLKRKKPDLDEEKLAQRAIQGMLQALREPSVGYLTPETYKLTQEDLTGRYGGIGAFVEQREIEGKSFTVIVAPMEGGPAERAGLQAGDIILEVDGQSVEGLPIREVVGMIRGPAGTEVRLKIKREGEPQPLEFTIVRGTIELPTVDVALLPGAIGYLFISEFTEATGDEVVDALEQLKRADFMALILDLRNNPGGSLRAARKVVSQFLTEGLFIYEINNKGERTDWTVEEGGIATEIPLAILVNKRTTSAAEAVAAVLQERGRAKVFGTPTFGKGSTMAFMKLEDGSAIYIPVSHWYTPSGRMIEGEGVKPDVLVPLSPEERKDTQLLEAYDYLDRLLPPFR